jgi:uncharacterized SAM-binding protein YcdF (DUF218 family)
LFAIYYTFASIVKDTLHMDFFFLSKIFWTIFKPDSILIFLLLFSLFLLINKNKILGIKILKATIFLFMIIAIFPIGQLLLSPLEYRFQDDQKLPRDIDGIIVLSGPENAKKSIKWNKVEIGDGAERSLMFMQLVRRYPNSTHVFSGGSGLLHDQGNSQADVAKKLYKNHGLNVQNIIFEKNSRNTYENAIFSKNRVKPSKHSKWGLITSAWHMPRAVGVFCNAGWNIVPITVDHITLPNHTYSLDFDFSGHLSELNIAFKEWIGLTAYWLTNKTEKIFPDGCYTN